MTTTAPPIAAATDEPSATTRFADAVRQLATRASRPEAERILRLAGPVLLPTGAIVILLGWYGAANTTRVFLQIPYLISGGLLGLGLMFAGGFLYFARWITDLLEESRRTAAQAHEVSERTAVALERIEQLLEERALPAEASPGSAATATATAPAASALVATERGSMVHRPDCRLVIGRPSRPATAGEGLRRCQICRPPLG